jgi:hypothetical protein
MNMQKNLIALGVVLALGAGQQVAAEPKFLTENIEKPSQEIGWYDPPLSDQV